MRDLRYQNKGDAKADQDEILYDEAMDETGTIDTVSRPDLLSRGPYCDTTNLSFLMQRVC